MTLLDGLTFWIKSFRASGSMGIVDLKVNVEFPVFASSAGSMIDWGCAAFVSDEVVCGLFVMGGDESV